MKNIQVLVLSFLISLATVLAYCNQPNKTLLIFGASWCRYCVNAKNDMKNNSKLSEIIKQYEIIDIDNDKDHDIVKGHNVKTLPTFIIFQDGKELKRVSGYNGPKDLIKFLQ